MKNYDKVSFINGKMKLKIITKVPEQILNIIWKRNIKVVNVNRENLYTISLIVNSENFSEIKKICDETNSNLSVVKVSKILGLVLNFKAYLTLAFGVGVSLGIILFLSMFIWKIDIVGDKHISPYEVRQVIKELGVHKGMLKHKIDTDFLEEQLIDKNKNVLWSKVRVQGSTLQIEVVESFSPPVIEIDESLGKIVAGKDGEIVRIYTQSGTAVVEKGNIVKKGDVLIEGYQGKENGTYEVPPIGSVIAKTFLEFEEVIELEGTKSVNTKDKVNEYYIFFKKYKDEFENFERVSCDSKFIKKNIYYEIDKSSYSLDSENVKKSLIEHYTKYVKQNLKQTDTIVGVLVKDEIVGNKLNLKMSFVIEEDIGIKVQKSSEAQ